MPLEVGRYKWFDTCRYKEQEDHIMFSGPNEEESDVSVKFFTGIVGSRKIQPTKHWLNGCQT